MSDNSDNLELFADILTITLSILLLIAIILALEPSLEEDLLVSISDPRLKSKLTEQQLQNGWQNARELSQKITVSSGKTREEQEAELAKLLSQAQPQELPSEDSKLQMALNRTDQRLYLSSIRMELMLQTLEDSILDSRKKNSALGEEINELQKQNLHKLYEFALASDRPPFYLVFRYGKLYPLSDFRNGELIRERKHVGWTEITGGTTTTAFLSENLGNDTTAALDYAEQLCRNSLVKGHYTPTIIVFDDSFNEAADFCEILNQNQMPNEWLPWSETDPLKLYCKELGL